MWVYDMKEILAERLRKCREEVDFPQIRVATYCDISEHTYQNYESARQQPRVSILVRIAKFYNVPIDYLVGLTDDPTPYPQRPE